MSEAEQVFRNLEDNLEMLRELASGVYEDGTPVEREMRAVAAELLSEHAALQRSLLPISTQFIIRWAYSDTAPEVRAVARDCLISLGALTAKELGVLTEDAAQVTALQRLKDAGWTDPTAIAG
jgi:hypothetical protein